MSWPFFPIANAIARTQTGQRSAHHTRECRPANTPVKRPDDRGRKCLTIAKRRFVLWISPTTERRRRKLRRVLVGVTIHIEENAPKLGMPHRGSRHELPRLRLGSLPALRARSWRARHRLFARRFDRPHLRRVGKSPPAAWALAIEPFDERRECGRLRKGHDRFECQWSAMSVVAICDSAD
jgi:hypothetical protein